MDVNDLNRADPQGSSEELFFFHRNRLVDVGRHYRDEYGRNKPFPHIVLDDFLPANVANRLAQDFPASDFVGYQQPDNGYQVKKLARVQEAYFEGVSPFIRHTLSEFNGLAFLDFLTAMTGIENLIPDPHFHAGALHSILPGGKLDIHADFNRDERRQLDRRINVIFYLNPLWKEEWGGQLELWDQEMKTCQKLISPIHNRCVVFTTTSTSYHGHPLPLACPQDVTRNSIAVYYYTNGRDDGANGAHGTLWQPR